jgi:hypothetical protein
LKKSEKILPVILMVWPYVFSIFLFLPDKTGEAHINFLIAYTIATLFVYGLNIWNAFSFHGSEQQLSFYGMLIKLAHIPFYVIGFALGALLLLSMVVPAFLFLSPIFLVVLAAVEFFLMLASSMYGISASVRMAKKGYLKKKSAVIYIVLHVIFVTDVISAVSLYKKTKIR